MSDPTLSDARRRIVDLLKLEGPITASAIAQTLGLTKVAVRQHLQGLEVAGLAQPRKQPAQGRGRPSMDWTLTQASARFFPDRHGELTVGLLGAMQEAFGDEGLERIIQQRSRRQVENYSAQVPPGSASLKARVVSLAKLRTAEGYLAEVVTEKPGSYLLVEHHCPICDAAKCCLRLCSSELEVFQETLGGGVLVERTAHILSGDERCVYRIRKR